MSHCLLHLQATSTTTQSFVLTGPSRPTTQDATIHCSTISIHVYMRADLYLKKQFRLESIHQIFPHNSFLQGKSHYHLNFPPPRSWITRGCQHFLEPVYSKLAYNKTWRYTHWHCVCDNDLKTKQSCTYLAELLKPILNWVHVCSTNILRTVWRTMIRFLIELIVRRTWFGQFDELSFVLNWLVMRCKLRPELAADAQQTAWSKM